LVARAVGGAASGSIYTAIDSLIVKWFKGRAISLALGISESSARLAEIIGFMSLARIVAYYSFEFALWIGSFIALTVLLSSFVLFALDSYGSKKKNTNREQQNNCPKPSDLSLFKAEYFILVFLVATYYGTLYVFVSNCSQLLQYKYDIDEVTADTYFTCMTLTGAVLSPFIGAYQDKKGLRGIFLSLGLFLLLSGYLSIVYVTNITPIIPIIVAGIGDAFTANCVLSLLSIIVPEEKYATGYGFMASIYFITQSLLFYVLGLINHDNSSRDTIKTNLELSITVLAFILCFGFVTSIIFNLYDFKNNGKYNKPHDFKELENVKFTELTVNGTTTRPRSTSTNM